MSQNLHKILMYHGIVASMGDFPDKREVGAELYDLTAEKFREQMDMLFQEGFKNTLCKDGDVTQMDDKCFVLTFDDGEMNNYELAFPILNEFGFKAYFFIIAKRVGKPGYMGWNELKEIHDKGMIIGSHGLSHEILTNLMDSQIEEELSASKKNLERNLNIKIDSLSIPRGFCNNKIVQMAYAAGYKNVFISERPKHLTERCISRIAVKGNWSMNRFKMVLNNSVPVFQKVKDASKQSAKIVLRESGYNFVRSLIIKVIR